MVKPRWNMVFLHSYTRMYIIAIFAFKNEAFVNNLDYNTN